MGEVTPLPWAAEGPDMFGDYNIIGPDEALAVAAVVSNMRDPAIVAANAAFIVRACNIHYDLLEALEALRAEVEDHTKRSGWAGRGAREIADNAIARARGES